MRLRRLEITGFKSFAQRTVLELEDGITAIVGPNGSGKSNVAEAILWVTGQVQARQLRGQRQEDVIFAGSDSRRPASWCEVEITFETGEKERPALGAEISVGRRVDRAGGSEVTLNGQVCRVRDLGLLFAGTGVGGHAYAFVGQGQVTSVLEGRSRDRKALVEEAAGVALHRRYLEEIQKYLSRSKPLLDRWQERLSLQEEALLPLEEQAQRARLYRQLKEEVRRLALGLARSRWETLSAGMSRGREELDAWQETLAQLEDQRARLDEEEARWWQASQEARRRREEEESRRRRLWREREQLLSRLGDLERQARLWEESLARGKERRASLEAMVAQWAQRAAQAQGAAPHPAQEDKELELLQERRRSLLARRQSLEKAGKEAQEALSRAEAAAFRRREIEGEKGRLQERLGQLEALYEEARREVEIWSQARRAAQKEREAAQEREQRLQKELLNLSRELGRLQGEREGYRARHFLGQGPRALLQARDEGAQGLQGLLGTVAELVAVPPHLRKAVEAALGGAGEYLVAATGEVAERAIGWLKEKGRGRATFLPLDQVRPPQLPQERALGFPGILGWLAEKVAARPGTEKAVSHALGRTVLAEDLGAARAFAKATGQRYKVVTLDGDLILPGGAMTGGSPAAARSLLQQVETMRALEERFQALQVQERERQRALHALQEDRRQAASREASGEGKEKRAREELLRLEKERQEALSRLERLKGEEPLLSAPELEEAAKKAREDLSRVEEEARRLEAEGAELEERWEKALEQERRLELEREKERLMGEEARWRLIRLQEEAKEEEDRAREALTFLEKVEGERAQLQEELAEKERQIGEAEALLQEGQEEAARVEERLEGLRRERQELERNRRSLEGRVRQGEAQLIRAEEELRHLLSRVREEFAAEEGELARVEPLAGPGLEEELQRRRQELFHLGGVDEGAIALFETRWTRYREEEERFRRYEGIYRRLEELAARLGEAVEKGYRGTLQRVKERFQELFSRLFGGGQADLLDEEGEGFSIVASPPGKKTERISLLSGGERSLVAIAFLFALLLENPPPFCLLDEMDAALDEANVERFGRLLREISRYTQVLVITHQRGTMEAADRLIGITMGDSGVSQVVAVELRQEGDGDFVYVDGAAAPGAAEDPAAIHRSHPAAGGGPGAG
ncbi:MAG: chromosome segregation protein SMC [Bacillota bacterium]|nr:chromosome segregation protein SMC [Bacillota bacterium]